MQITHTEFGSAVTHSLKTGGENIQVTNTNRHGPFFSLRYIVVALKCTIDHIHWPLDMLSHGRCQ